MSSSEENYQMNTSAVAAPAEHAAAASLVGKERASAAPSPEGTRHNDPMQKVED